MTYEDAGVPHLKGDPGYNREIVKLIRSTHRPGVTGNPTGFASLFDLKKTGVRDPLLVSSTDGVGTKLEIAHLQKKHDTIGIDLVAMCVNDLICTGAQPLFFLDYFATGKFNQKVTVEVLKGIAQGCKQAECALVGGETAVMPGFYCESMPSGDPQYDLAGFSVGVVDRKKVVTGKTIDKGDQLIGLASSGFHSNGYSLLRRIFNSVELAGDIGRILLIPTRIYVKPILKLLKVVPLEGIVNITGGGFIDNLPRVIPDGLAARILSGSWEKPKIFDLVRDSGNITDFEMMRTFNLGVGMILIVKPKWVKKTQSVLQAMKIQSWIMGEIVKAESKSKVIVG
ncbi:MAG: phosphoribosylformylglycinamidine cyclo-ligase [Candidatus Omnitrophica bacterium]|nr:phosphoribosylformylglycinamidine cyclo-ligase [Candidatus Omnitrophota bacterium]